MMRVEIADISQAGEARRAAGALSRDLRLGETDAGRLALIATEAATNIARHAGAGYLLIRATGTGTGVEMLAVDCGPGMATVSHAMRDGFSTGGTSGTGLGAMRRLADMFDIYTSPGKGTVLFARVGEPSTPVVAGPAPELGVVSLPMPGERVCGDGWAAEASPSGILLLVADGLGHGPFAHDASIAAVRVFRERTTDSLPELIHAMHAALRATRGSACSVVHIDERRGRVRFAGIGNISCAVIGPEESHSFSSMNGTVGHELRKVQEFELAWTDRSLLIAHTDGIGTRWRLDQYPGLGARHPAIVCAVLYRDFARGRDDATILALRTQRAREIQA